MRLQLVFKNLEQDVLNAVAMVRVNDTSEFDAPATLLSSVKSAEFNVFTPDTITTIDIDLPVLNDQADFSLSVRVDGKIAGGESIRFINTSLTPFAESDEWHRGVHHFFECAEQVSRGRCNPTHRGNDGHSLCQAYTFKR